MGRRKGFFNRSKDNTAKDGTSRKGRNSSERRGILNLSNSSSSSKASSRSRSSSCSSSLPVHSILSSEDIAGQSQSQSQLQSQGPLPVVKEDNSTTSPLPLRPRDDDGSSGTDKKSAALLKSPPSSSNSSSPSLKQRDAQNNKNINWKQQNIIITEEEQEIVTSSSFQQGDNTNNAKSNNENIQDTSQTANIITENQPKPATLTETHHDSTRTNSSIIPSSAQQQPQLQSHQYQQPLQPHQQPQGNLFIRSNLSLPNHNNNNNNNFLNNNFTHNLVTRIPPVNTASQEIWMVPLDDFHGVAHAIHFLNMAILHEGTGANHPNNLSSSNHTYNSLPSVYNNNNNNNMNNNMNNPSITPMFTYDPTEIFLSIKDAAIRWHEQWMELAEERIRIKNAHEARVLRRILREERKLEREEKAKRMEREKEKKEEEEEEEVDTQDTKVQVPSEVKVDIGAHTSIDDATNGAGVDEEDKSDNKNNSNNSSPIVLQPTETEEEDNDYSDSDDTIDYIDIDMIESDEIWNAREQAAWNIWEESMSCCASLAKFCIGPAWRYQIHERQRLIQGLVDRHDAGSGNSTTTRPTRTTSTNSGTTDSVTSSTQQTHTQDSVSISTLGMASNRNNSTRSTSPLLFGGSRGTGGTNTPGTNSPNMSGDENETSSASSSTFGSNPQSAAPSSHRASRSSRSGTNISLEYPSIPEVLPSAMLRLADICIESYLPPIHGADTNVEISRNKDCVQNDDCDGRDRDYDNDAKPAAAINETNTLDLKDFDVSISELIWEEQKWLLRRRQIGDSQRELVTALLCDDDIDMLDIDEEADSTRTNRSTLQWSVPGAHAPVAKMVLCWVETAMTGWPTPVEEQFHVLNPKGQTGLSSSSNGLKEDMESSQHTGSTTTNNMGAHVSLPWASIANSGAIDWWYTVNVTRGVSDLVNAGWRPPPHGFDAEQSVLGLLVIVEKGVMLSVHDMSHSPDDTHPEAREERLAASASAAEAMCALTSLGTRGLIPKACVGVMARVLCRLVAAADSSISNIADVDLFPLGSSDDEIEIADLMLEQQTFLSQREACLADMAELLWSLLAHRPSMCSAADVLLDTIDIDLSKPVITNTENSALPASGAIRALGAALWGNPPAVKGIPFLRIYWCNFLEMLSKISSSLHDYSSCLSVPLEMPSQRSRMNSNNSYQGRLFESTAESKSAPPDFTTVPPMKSQASYHTASLVAFLEVTIALRRLVDGEITMGSDSLSPFEWEPFIHILEKGLLPWFVHTINHPDDGAQSNANLLERNDFLFQRIKFEIRGIFVQVQGYLIQKDSTSFSFQPVIDEAARLRLHTLYFRLIAPYFPKQKSSDISISIIASWIHSKGVYHRSHDWCKKASDILIEAFAVYPDRRYVHPPSVRQAAMYFFVESDEDCSLYEDLSLCNSSVCDGDTITTDIVRIAQDIHMDKICSILLPCIKEVLCLSCRFRRNVGMVFPDIVSSANTDVEDSECEYRLRRSAIQLVGEIFRKGVVERDHRVGLINILKTFATNTYYPKCKEEQQSLMGKFLSFHEATALKLQATHELGLCLDAPFSMAPQLGASATVLIEALCDVASVYGQASSIDMKNVFETKAEMENADYLLAIVSLYHLSRLRLSHGKKAVLIERSCNSLIPDLLKLMENFNLSFVESAVKNGLDVGSIQSNDDFVMNKECAVSTVAPLISIDPLNIDNHSHEELKVSQLNTLEGTTIQTSPIVGTIRGVLRSLHRSSEKTNSKNLEHHYNEDMNFMKLLRVLCFDTLSAYILSGMVLHEEPDDIIELVVAPDSSCYQEHIAEKSSRSRLVMAYTYLFLKLDPTLDNYDQHKRRMYTEIVTFFSGKNVEQIMNAGHCISILTASTYTNLTSKDTDNDSSNMMWWSSESASILLEKVQSFLREKRSKEIDTLVVVLSTLFDLFSLTPRESFQSKDRVQMVLTCYDVIDLCESCNCKYCDCIQSRLLSIQCATATIGMMDKHELEEVDVILYHRREHKITVENRKRNDDEYAADYHKILNDLLSDRYMRLSNPTTVPTCQKYKSSALTPNELLAKQTTDIENFSVDNDEDENSAAWLHENVLFTLRKGDPNSSHGGWVEIIVRSPTSLIRRAVRLSDYSISLMNPEFPLSLWDTLLQKNDSGVILYTTSEGSTASVSSSIMPPSTCDSQVISNAKESIDRFNKIRTPPIRQSNIPSSRVSSEREMIDSDLVEDKYMKRHRSTGDLFIESNGIPPEELDTSVQSEDANQAFGIKNILHEVFDNTDYMLQVEKEVQNLEHSSSLFTKSIDNDSIKRLYWDSKLQRSLNVLDRTAPYQTHKIALIFQGPNTSDKEEKNDHEDSKNDYVSNLDVLHASPLFSKFCNRLGNLVPTQHLRHFSGGLDTSPYVADGKFALCWIDYDNENDTGKRMVLFHSVPLMPPGVNNRKRHVGNDVVHIVYYEAPPNVIIHDDFTDVSDSTISGEFGFVTIFVSPLTHSNNELTKVTMKLKQNLDDKIKQSLKHIIGNFIIPTSVAPIYVRQVSIRADLACRSMLQDRLGPFSGPCDRLEQIGKMHRFVEQ